MFILSEKQRFFNRDVKSKCLEAMSSKLKELGVEATEKQISKKISDLKIYYGTQKHLTEGSKSSRKAIDEVYVSP